jgi:energy-coupling factor transport system ATP-binding protein
MIPEGQLRAHQIITARYARGLIVKRSRLAALAQLPHVLRPLVAWTVRAALDRADLWIHRGLLEKVQENLRRPVVVAEDPLEGSPETRNALVVEDTRTPPEVVQIRSFEDLQQLAVANPLMAVLGSNFSGRTNALRRVAGLDPINGAISSAGAGAYVGAEVHAAISGLARTVDEELRIYRAASIEASPYPLARGLGLDALLTHEATTLSGGEQAALAIACALALHPKSLAIDCAFEQLDDEKRRIVMKRISSPALANCTRLIADNRFEELSNDDRACFDTICLIESQLANVDVAVAAEAEPITRDFTYRLSTAPFALELRQLSFAYGANRGAPVLENVSATLLPGHTYILNGQNGAGKSTLAKLLCGTLKPRSGVLCAAGKPFSPWLTPGRSVGYHFQNADVQLFCGTVAEELVVGAHAHWSDTATARAYAADVLRSFGLERLATRHPLDLPYVIRKRVALAASITAGAPWLILDEPTLGQDDSAAAALAMIIDQIASTGAGVIVISHSDAFRRSLEKASVLHIESGRLSG